MAIFNVHAELNKFYEDHVRLGENRRKVLAGYRDACLDRLTDGLNKLAEERNTTYCTFARRVNQGSYPMRTLNQHPNHEYDIDVAVIFKKDDLPTTALEARNRVADALLKAGGNFRKDPEARTNAVTVWYADGAHVDLAVYREVEGFWENKLEHAGAEWSERDPQAITEWFNKQVEDRSATALFFFDSVEPGQLRRVVRWFKAFARSRTSWSLPGGMILTAVGAEEYQGDGRRDDIALYNTLMSIRSRLESNLDVNNPVTSLPLTEKPQIKAQMKRLLEKLDYVMPYLEVIEEDDCTEDRAYKAWNKVFNHEFWGAGVEAEGPEPEPKTMGVVPVEITAAIAKSKGGSASVSKFNIVPLPKGRHIRFTLPPAWGPKPGRKFRWIVKNTGDEARAALATDPKALGYENTGDEPEAWRHGEWKGSHTMTVEVLDDGRVVARGTRKVRVTAW